MGKKLIEKLAEKTCEHICNYIRVESKCEMLGQMYEYLEQEICNEVAKKAFFDCKKACIEVLNTVEVEEQK
jgi:hypothetical protein